MKVFFPSENFLIIQTLVIRNHIKDFFQGNCTNFAVKFERISRKESLIWRSCIKYRYNNWNLWDDFFLFIYSHIQKKSCKFSSTCEQYCVYSKDLCSNILSDIIKLKFTDLYQLPRIFVLLYFKWRR